MAATRNCIHGEWSSPLAFVLAAAGSAVGLGNIWKFPYLAGEYGGGAFVLIYLLSVAVIGIPIMMAEVMLGRRGRRSPINTMRALAEDEGHSPRWSLLGWMGVIAGFLIFSYYSVIAGWTLGHVFFTASGSFSGASADQVAQHFEDFTADPWALTAWHTVFVIMAMVVVARGVKSGLEPAVRYLMPMLFLLLLALVAYAAVAGNFTEAMSFLFKPDFSEIGGEAVLAAFGQAFFSLSLGMGAIMVYGSYLPARASIARTSISVAVADCSVAILAGIAIFPIVFANGLPAAAGPGLVFKSLPLAFGQMPFGILFGSLFFVLLLFAAWTSAISLIEPAVAYLVENRKWKRPFASFACGSAIWFVGLGTVFSFNLLADWRVSDHAFFADRTIFDLLDYLTSNIMLPLGGFLIAIFAAWLLTKKSSESELALSPNAFAFWRFLVRYVTPIGIVLIFLNATGMI